MRKDFFERDYGHLLDSDDAVKVFGTASIEKDVATVGDIRRAIEGHPPDASIYPENNASGFYVTDSHGKFFTVGRL
jgi:hypothetical protein